MQILLERIRAEGRGHVVGRLCLLRHQPRQAAVADHQRRLAIKRGEWFFLR
jgi:hypothetical protein